MKKTIAAGTPVKLSLSRETVRVLTDRDLELVAAGACRKSSVKTNIVPPPNGIITVPRTC